MEPTPPETIEHESIIVPRKASQLFGAYLRQEFKGSLETIGEPHNHRLFNFIDNLEFSEEVKLMKKRVFIDFEFSEKKDHSSTANNFTMSNVLTPDFLRAIDHNVKNALNILVQFDEKMSLKMAAVITALSDASGLEMSRDESGKVKVIPIFQTATIT